MDANELNTRRDAMLGKDSPSASGAQTERVFKMFTPFERARVIKANPVKVILGSGNESREFTIRPLTPRQMVEAYGLMTEILVPLMKQFEPSADGTPKNIGFMDLARSLGDNIDKIPLLVHIILSRGNDVSLDWVNDHLDILLDLQMIIPAVVEQNGLDKLFGGKDQPSAAPTPPAEVVPSSGTPLLTAASPV